MAKRKKSQGKDGQNSDRNSSRKNSRRVNIESNALLPARGPDGDPILLPVLPIKTEPLENDDPQLRNPEIQDLLSMLEEAKKRKVTAEDALSESSSHPSTVPEPLETDEGSVLSTNCSSNLTGNEELPLAYTQVQVKREPTESEVADVQTEYHHSSTVNTNEILPSDNPNAKSYTLSNDHFPKNDVFTPILNDQIKNEPFHNNEISEDHEDPKLKLPILPSEFPKIIETSNYLKEQSIESLKSENYQDEDRTDTTVCTKTKELEEHQETQKENENVEFSLKRKLQDERFKDKFEMIRKRLKVEPHDDSEKLPILPNEDQAINISSMPSYALEKDSLLTPPHKNGTLEKGDASQIKNGLVDNDILEDLDNEIAVVPIERVEKNIQVITLDDDDDDSDEYGQKNPGSENISSSDSNPKLLIPLQSSTSITSSKKNKKISTDILKYFNVDSELDRYHCQKALEHLSEYETNDSLQKFFPIITRKPTQEIKKGDILFKTSATVINSNDNLSIPANVQVFSNGQVLKPASELLSRYTNSPDPLISQSAPLKHELFALPVSSNSKKNLLTNFQPVISPTSNSINRHPNLQSVISPTSNSINPPPNLQVVISHSTSNLNVKKSASDISKEQLINILGNLKNPNENNKVTGTDRTFSLVNGSRIQAAHTSITPPQALSQAAPNLDFQKLSIPSNSASTQFMSATSSSASTQFMSATSSSASRDPRLVNHKATYPPRKGERDLLLYKNVGKEEKATEYFEKLILQWNPEWLDIQRSSGGCPPICDSYPFVQNCYPNEALYLNTYLPLHLLHVWYKFCECHVGGRAININCTCESVEKSENVIKIFCFTELEDVNMWPKRDDIVLCHHKKDKAFLRVEDVKMRATTMQNRMKLRISLESVHDLKIQSNEDISFRILFNIQTSCSQAKALKSLDESMKTIILKPNENRGCIKNVQFESENPVKGERNYILDEIALGGIRVLLIETSCSVPTLLTMLSFSIAVNPPKKATDRQPANVLVCFKNKATFLEACRLLETHKPILAVRTKQLPDLAENLKKRTLEDPLKRKEVLDNKKKHIFLTTFSAFGTAEKNNLSKLKELVCIIEEAQYCTEAETALPLTLNIKKLLLIKGSEYNVQLPIFLKNHGYHTSLFNRLEKFIPPIKVRCSNSNSLK